MKTAEARLAILTILAALGGHAIAAPVAGLNARWAEEAFPVPPLGEPAGQGGPVAVIPFSFVHGGKPSPEPAARISQQPADDHRHRVHCAHSPAL